MEKLREANDWLDSPLWSERTSDLTVADLDEDLDALTRRLIAQPEPEPAAPDE